MVDRYPPKTPWRNPREPSEGQDIVVRTLFHILGRRSYGKEENIYIFDPTGPYFVKPLEVAMRKLGGAVILKNPIHTDSVPAAPRLHTAPNILGAIGGRNVFNFFILYYFFSQNDLAGRRWSTTGQDPWVENH